MSNKNVRSIILRAYQDANIVGQGRDMADYQLSDGLESLNELIVDLSSSGVTIPYQTRLNFNLQTNVQDYRIDMNPGAAVESQPLTDLNFVTVYLGSVAIPIKIITTASYYLANRNTTGSSIPESVLLRKSNNSSTLTFYLIPAQVLNCDVVGLTQMSEVNGTELVSSMPTIWRRFLRFSLAIEFAACNQSLELPDWYKSEYDKLYNKLVSNSPLNVQSDNNVFFTSSGYTQDIKTYGGLC
jgi:hypothetical protein